MHKTELRFSLLGLGNEVIALSKSLFLRESLYSLLANFSLRIAAVGKEHFTFSQTSKA
jgi:hypothetical protein